jgi:non-heme chloroperoxidase
MDQPTALPRFANVRVATGVRLHYAEQGAPGARPLILLHGISDSWFSFSRVLPGLAATYRVFALSLRGHGDSERPATGYNLPDFAADVVAFMDALGIERAAVVGHSMGSMVAQQVALMAPERVERLVLVGSAADARNINGVDELGDIFGAFEDPVPEEFVRDFQSSNAYQPLPPGFLDQVVADSMKLTAHVWRGSMLGLLAANFTPHLARIKMPTLLLWGDKDAYFPRSEQDALVAGLPQATLKVCHDIGHCPQWEAPEQFIRDLEGFIG